MQILAIIIIVAIFTQSARKNETVLFDKHENMLRLRWRFYLDIYKGYPCVLHMLVASAGCLLIFRCLPTCLQFTQDCNIVSLCIMLAYIKNILYCE